MSSARRNGPTGMGTMIDLRGKPTWYAAHGYTGRREGLAAHEARRDEPPALPFARLVGRDDHRVVNRRGEALLAALEELADRPSTGGSA